MILGPSSQGPTSAEKIMPTLKIRRRVLIPEPILRTEIYIEIFEYFSSLRLSL